MGHLGQEVALRIYLTEQEEQVALDVQREQLSGHLAAINVMF